MDELFSECLAFTLLAEGGYVYNPDDPGGATNMGITLATYRTWSDDPSAGISQIRDLTMRIAGVIYRTLYWNPLRGDALPAGIDLSVFDFGVNAGVWRSGRVLQLALGFSGDTVDGCVGSETLAAAYKADARELIEALASRQAMYYCSLKDYSFFGQGWLKRTEARRDAALAMLDNSPTRKV